MTANPATAPAGGPAPARPRARPRPGSAPPLPTAAAPRRSVTPSAASRPNPIARLNAASPAGASLNCRVGLAPDEDAAPVEHRSLGDSARRTTRRARPAGARGGRSEGRARSPGRAGGRAPGCDGGRGDAPGDHDREVRPSGSRSEDTATPARAAPLGAPERKAAWRVEDPLAERTLDGEALDVHRDVEHPVRRADRQRAQRERRGVHGERGRDPRREPQGRRGSPGGETRSTPPSAPVSGWAIKSPTGAPSSASPSSPCRCPSRSWMSGSRAYHELKTSPLRKKTAVTATWGRELGSKPNATSPRARPGCRPGRRRGPSHGGLLRLHRGLERVHVGDVGEDRRAVGFSGSRNVRMLIPSGPENSPSRFGDASQFSLCRSRGAQSPSAFRGLLREWTRRLAALQPGRGPPHRRERFGAIAFPRSRPASRSASGRPRRTGPGPARRSRDHARRASPM